MYIEFLQFDRPDTLLHWCVMLHFEVMLQASGRPTTKRDFLERSDNHWDPWRPTLHGVVTQCWVVNHGLITVFVVQYKLRDAISVPA